jgi:hypothetical protein
VGNSKIPIPFFFFFLADLKFINIFSLLLLPLNKISGSATYDDSSGSDVILTIYFNEVVSYVTFYV